MAPPTPAADALFAEHAPALRNFLGARCRDPDLAADLLQETAARLVAAGPRLDANGNPRGYLFRIAANVWRDHLRREIVRRRTLDALRQQGGAGGGGGGRGAAGPAARPRGRGGGVRAPGRGAVAAGPVWARLGGIAADGAIASHPGRRLRWGALGALSAAGVVTAVLLGGRSEPPRPLAVAVPRYAVTALAPIDSILTRLEQENLYAIP